MKVLLINGSPNRNGCTCATPEEAARDEEGMQNMRILGRNMAWHLKCIRAASNAGILPPKAEVPVFTNFIADGR